MGHPALVAGVAKTTSGRPLDSILNRRVLTRTLKEAQLEMREQVRMTHDGKDLPYYWGAFVLVGR
jgi:hypothetical protein